METWKNTSLMEKRKQGMGGGNRHRRKADLSDLGMLRIEGP